jgi:ABC-2 type transport system permease protein
MRLLWLDYLAALRERKTWLVVAAFAYALLGVPVLLSQPPAHVEQAITAWLGDADPFARFLYVWIDLALNKLVAFVPVVLAGGLVLRERDTGVLALLASKPITLARYFVLRTLSACAVMATLYVGAHLVGALWLSSRIEGFRVGTFLAAASLHLFAAVFATALVAALSVWIGRRGPATLVSLLVLFSLAGMALIGVYNPSWRAVARLNPLALGAEVLHHRLDALGPATLGPPALALALATALVIGVGARGAARLEV